MKIEIPNSLLVTLSGQTSRGIKAAEGRESDGHLLFTLTDGSKIDLGAVVGPAGTPGTKGDKGEPGAAGYSPAAKVQRTETGAIITITDKNGTSYASVSDGKDGSPGAKGDPGEDYVLTTADKQEIAASVVAGGLEVEVSDETPGGSDPSLGLTGAAVGQIAKITSVDADGKPTAWSPVDMPSGGLSLLYYTEISDGNTAPYIELPITDLQRYHKISWAIFVPTFAPEASTNIIRLKIAPAGSQWYSGVIYSFCPGDESIKLSMRGEIDVCGNKVIAYCASNQKQYQMISFSGNASSLPQELDANSRIFVELYNRNVGNLPEMTIAIYGE